MKPEESMKEVGKPFKVRFPNGASAYAIRVHRSTELSIALCKLGFRHSRPVLALVGGADEMSEADMARLHPLFVEVLAPLAEALGVSVVDGGTDSGVMRLMGQAHVERQATFPLIGVAATGTVALPDAPPRHPDAAPLEPNHTHFVLVPGSEWGDESPWLARVASVLAAEAPSVTLLVNGGQSAWKDVSQSVEAGRRVIAIAGSGRAADMLAAALHGAAVDGWAKDLAASGLVQAVDLSSGSDVLIREIEQTLCAKE